MINDESRKSELKWLLGVDCVGRTKLGAEGEVGGWPEGRTELVGLYELLLGDGGGGWRGLADVDKLETRSHRSPCKLRRGATTGRHLLVGLDGGDCLRPRGYKLYAGTEGLWRGFVAGGEAEVTRYFNTETVGLQVLLTESAAPGSA